ncbi:hypothetical protein BGY98DRAFT_1104701 [Russula aff. rugulosa BPL654]|nr:hypothetical protein BGY98DRAFT_1104701 [Russula aff. rugulosa BPL654]
MLPHYRDISQTISLAQCQASHLGPAIPPNGPSLAIQWQSATEPDTTAISGSLFKYQDPQLPVGSAVPYMNQNVDGAHPTGLDDIVDGQIQAWSDEMQALNQEIAGYAPLPDAVGPIQIENDAVPDEALDVSVLNVFGASISKRSICLKMA